MQPTSRADRITLSGIVLRPRIGVTPGERRFPQACDAELTLWGDFRAAADTDSLDRAIDYTRVLACVGEVADAREYNLIEALAYRIAREVLQRFPVGRVSVRLRKRPASLAGKLDFVEVALEES